MVTYTTPRLGAIAVGALCAVGAAGVLLADIYHTQTVTIDHALSVIVLIGTIAAGVMAVDALKALRTLPQAVVLAALFCTGSAYCVMSTAGRTAESRAVKQIEAETRNAARAEILANRKKDQDRLDKKREEHAAECKSGKGKRCDGIKESIAVYEAAVKGHEADLAALGPEQPVNTKIKNVSAIAAAITGRDVKKIEALATLIDPNIPALFLEAGSIVFLHIGRPAALFAMLAFGWRRREPEVDLYARMKAFEESQGLPTSPAPTPPQGPKPRKPSRPDQRREQVASFVGAYRARHGHDPEPAEVRRATGLPRSTAWRYQQEAMAS